VVKNYWFTLRTEDGSLRAILKEIKRFRRRRRYRTLDNEEIIIEALRLCYPEVVNRLKKPKVVEFRVV